MNNNNISFDLQIASYDKHGEVNIQKLIELVVNQCVIICTETGDITRKGCQVTEADVCGYKIKQYFGIK
jgi:hypothetical protein